MCEECRLTIVHLCSPSVSVSVDKHVKQSFLLCLTVMSCLYYVWMTCYLCLTFSSLIERDRYHVYYTDLTEYIQNTRVMIPCILLAPKTVSQGNLIS